MYYSSDNHREWMTFAILMGDATDGSRVAETLRLMEGLTCPTCGRLMVTAIQDLSVGPQGGTVLEAWTSTACLFCAKI